MNGMDAMDATDVIVYLAAGSTLGAIYFRLLAGTVRLHAARAAATLVIALYVGRLAAAVAAFWLIVQQGALPLLLALLGFLLARSIAQHRMRQA
ncbi:MAG: hypothetical protein D6773_06950 [Alphaproteobacteria bacterium]|nr:MAG: hypothetical protein D6773_06950 [Alphaproteobacteria bacterium]